MHVTELPAPIAMKGHRCVFRLAHPHETDEKKLYGFYQSPGGTGEAEIIVEGGLSSARRAEVVLHEVLHFIYHVYGISPRWGEERTVMMFGIGLTDLFRQNPKFQLWLTPLIGASSQTEKIENPPTNASQASLSRPDGGASQARRRGTTRTRPQRRGGANIKR